MIAQKKYRHAMELYAQQEHTDFEHRVAGLLYQAAYSGLKEAQFMMPFLNLTYFCQNSERPDYWYRLAAEQGHPYAQYLHAVNLLSDADRNNPEAMNQAKTEAIRWMKKAATGGTTSAAYTIHYVYLLGLWGMPVDDQQAKFWLEIAQKNHKQYYDFRRKSKENTPDGCMPEGWDKDFHKESVFFIDARDYQKWNAYASLYNSFS